MAMKAQLRTDAIGNITIHMEGGLNFENSGSFRKELEDLTITNPTSVITLDMNRLEFVGSSGIGFFVDTIKALNAKRDQLRISNVKSEFLKVFKLYDLNLMDVLIDEFESDDTHDMSQRFGNRKMTFQN
ncbi:MAG: STAS domain-containing protein [Halobacteriovoraceae bacterium]|jgi:anti-sigma B factor antagonist|nr:STAS domain-containing protein [Halobacteriovoraceae bacterium]